MTIMDSKAMNIGFIGSGNMAFAIASAIIKKGTVPKENIFASAPSMRNLYKMKDMGCTVDHKNDFVLEKCNIILLCVKPYKVDEALRDLQRCWTNDHVVISIVAGISIKTLYNYIPHRVKVARVLPNLPVLVNAGVFAYCVPADVDQKEVAMKKIIEHLFNDLGNCKELNEEQLDVACGLCGSGPAFIFTVIQGLSDGAVKMGLSRNLATELAAQTVMGSAKLVLETGKHPDLLRDEVCSPSGTSIAGCEVLEGAGIRATFLKAVESATLRSKELGKLIN